MGYEPTFGGAAVNHGGPFFYGPRLFLMPHLFDYFYRAVWDILAAPRKKGKGRRNGCSIVVSCCNRREGASTIALNLAAAFARNSTKNVVLVDGNLRDPALHSCFGLNREGGLVEMVTGEIGTYDAIVQVEEERFDFVSAGRPVENPILLYESSEFAGLLDELGNKYDVAIFDSSPIIQYPETPILASAGDGLILTLENESTSWEVAAAAKGKLEKTGVNIFGAILNKREYYIPRVIYDLL